MKNTKFISSEQCTGPIPDGQGEEIETLRECRYHGSDLSGEGDIDRKVRGRIGAAWLK